jgi:hypothetical protein
LYLSRLVILPVGQGKDWLLNRLNKVPATLLSVSNLLLNLIPQNS